MSESRFSVIIPVHNGLTYTAACITEIVNSLSASEIQTGLVPIVVIDDGSTDGTADYLKKHFPYIHILQGNGNLWWSGAINRGIKYSLDDLKVDYVLLWNNDIFPGQGYFRKAIEVINSNSGWAIICSVIYFKNPADRILSTGGFFNTRNGSKSLYNYGVKESEAVFDNLRIDWFGGMGTFIRKDVFEQIGFFDEIRFPQYHGDSDFGIRATLAGLTIHLARELKIWNDVTNSGLHRQKSFHGFIQSFYSIKSNYNLKKDILFYRLYAKSYLAYGELMKKYLIYIAAFIKWKILGLFGIKKAI